MNWAEKEIELACKKENPDWDGESFDYGCAIYQSALKAYKAAVNAVENDGHSGFSYNAMINVLQRLLTNKPLTPIENVAEDWKLVYKDHDGTMHYQCTRYLSLFKTVHVNGVAEYSDCDRVIGVMDSDKDLEGICFHGRKADSFVNNKWPIAFPYMPADKPYMVYFHTDDDAVPYKIVDPNGMAYFPTPKESEESLNYADQDTMMPAT